eukprot:1458596-Prymnesium_polylepis.1
MPPLPPPIPPTPPPPPLQPPIPPTAPAPPLPPPPPPPASPAPISWLSVGEGACRTASGGLGTLYGGSRVELSAEDCRTRCGEVKSCHSICCRSRLPLVPCKGLTVRSPARSSPRASPTSGRTHSAASSTWHRSRKLRAPIP